MPSSACRKVVLNRRHSGCADGLRPAAGSWGELQGRQDILFVDASKEFDSGRNQNTLTNGHIEQDFPSCRGAPERR